MLTDCTPRRDVDSFPRQNPSSNVLVSLIGLLIEVDRQSCPVVDSENDLQFCAHGRSDQDILDLGNRYGIPAPSLINALDVDFSRSLTLDETTNSVWYQDCRKPVRIKIETWYFPLQFSRKNPGVLLRSRGSQTAKSLLATMPKIIDAVDINTTPQQMDDTIKEYLRRDEPEQRISAYEFFCGNPNVEVIRGIVHLFRENLRVPRATAIDRNSIGCRSDMICMLNVPSKITCPDLLHFVQSNVSSFSDALQYVRILDTGSEDVIANGTYLVLIKFKTHAAADRFYELNGAPYTLLEQTSRCQLAYVARVDYTRDGQQAPAYIAGGLGADRKETPEADHHIINSGQLLPFSSSSVGNSSSFTELPMCIVCLERMDEAVDGIVTILCNHSFHSSCLARGAVLTCPVCRYFATPQQHEDQTCMQCDMEHDLWICLICGNVGCGRYSNGGHAVSHWISSNHTYAMNIDTRRVWDYAGDNYVHRLIQGDGSSTKPIAVDGNGMSDGEKNYMYVNAGDSYNDSSGRYNSSYVDNDEQKDSINLEFHYVLSRSLEEQRAFFEKKEEETAELNITRISKLEQLLNESSVQCRHLAQQCADLRRERDELEKRYQQQLAAQQHASSVALEHEKHLNTDLLSKQKENQEACKKLRQELVDLNNRLENQNAEARRERESFEKRIKKLTDQLQTTTKALADEKQLTDILSLNQKECKEDCNKLRAQLEAFTTQKDTEINELQEQIRDLMFHFQKQSEISNLDESQREEIQGGHVEVGSTTASGDARRGGLATKTKRRR